MGKMAATARMPISTIASSDIEARRPPPGPGPTGNAPDARHPIRPLGGRAHAHPAGWARSAGFTLLEVSLVLLIFAVILTFAIPRLRDSSRLELASHARRLATTFRLLRNEAILNGRVYRLNYDLDRRRYWTTLEPGFGELGEGRRDTGGMARPVTLPDTVAFSDIVLQSAGKLNQGQVYTRFFPDGFVDPTVVHMDNGREAFTLTVWPLTGQVSVYEGYRELEFIVQ